MYLYNLTIRVQFRAPALDIAHQHQGEIVSAVKAALGDRLEGWDFGDRKYGVESDPSNLGGERVKIG